MRDVRTTKYAEWFCEFCEVCVKSNCEITIPDVGSQIFYFHTETTEFTEAHLLRVLAMQDVYVRPSWAGGPI